MFEENAITRLNHLSITWDRVDAAITRDLPPVEYFEEHAPYLDLKPMKAFLWASIHLDDLFKEVKTNAGRLAWDSVYEDEIFDRINEAHQQVEKTKDRIKSYTDLWNRLEVCREFETERAEKEAREVIECAKNGTPFSPA